MAILEVVMVKMGSGRRLWCVFVRSLSVVSFPPAPAGALSQNELN